MAVRALAANNEVVASTETYVSSNLAFHVRVSLPLINDGTGGTVAVGKEIRFDALGTSSIEIVTLKSVRVGIVPSGHSACVVARAGQVQGENDRWVLEPVRSTLATFQTISASPTQAEVTALRDCLVKAGLMKAE